MENPLYLDPTKPFAERAKDLVSRMTTEEKISQVWYKSQALPHLKIREYDWWNECLHGVGRAGIATVFPQAIALGALFDKNLMKKIATIISDEARAKYHEFQRNKEYERYKGLTFWSPNINIFRDPRWGRGQETYGEDPYLTAQLGIEFVKGLQGDDPKYLKLVATPKHYVVHSGPENERHSFNAVCSEKDFRETYLYAFKECVQKGNAVSVMGAYNRTNGELCSGSELLLQTILRQELGFQGYVVSDCGAIADFHRHHKVTNNAAESAAMGMKNGCDLNCGRTYRHLNEALEQNLITETELDQGLLRLMEARLRLGMFDPDELVPWASIPFSKNDCEEHRLFAQEIAEKTMVLLKNSGILPLDSTSLTKIGIVGPNADNLDVLLGNYEGTPSKYSTPLTGIQDFLGQKKVIYQKGCSLRGRWLRNSKELLNKFKDVDIIIACLGISPKIEGEQRGTPWQKADRDSLDLFTTQQKLLLKLKTLNIPIISCLFSGSPISDQIVEECSDAIIECWYPGEEGGKALANILFGKVSPSGRLPLTFVDSVKDLPPFRDYNMEGRTYRFLTKEPRYPFGFGLSYTEFAYNDLELSSESIELNQPLNVSVNVKNVGSMEGDEVVQVYIKDMEASVRVPNFQLVRFTRVHLNPGEEIKIDFELQARDFALINDEGKCFIEPGTFKIYLGGSQPDLRSGHLTKLVPLESEIRYKGELTPLTY